MITRKKPQRKKYVHETKSLPNTNEKKKMPITKIDVIVAGDKKITRKIYPKKPRKPRSQKTPLDRMYFTKDTELAIVNYNTTECPQKREDIFNAEIKYPLEKLVENIFNTFKFSYLETGPLEAQKETVSHLVVNMNKFDPSMGFKAYSYFSIVAKNFLIALNNNNYKRFNQHVDISEEHDRNSIQLQTEDKHYQDTETTEFIDLMVRFWEANIEKIFPKKRDIAIANSVVELFRNSDGIDAYNKKAYIYT